MPEPWPWPGDTAIDKPRRVAQEYRRHLERLAPDLCALVDQTMVDHGERWVTGEEVTTGDILTTADAALLLSITPRGVRAAVRRGALEAAGQDSDGYLFERTAVMAYATRERRVVADRRCSPVPS